MITGITYGTFDLLHVGHVRLFQRIKEQCDNLIVAVSTDTFNELKGKCATYSFVERFEIISSIKYVDLVIPEFHWDQKINDVDKFQVDKFFMGDDWLGKFDFLKPHCEVIYLPRTENISSTEIKHTIRSGN